VNEEQERVAAGAEPWLGEAEGNLKGWASVLGIWQVGLFFATLLCGLGLRHESSGIYILAGLGLVGLIAAVIAALTMSAGGDLHVVHGRLTAGQLCFRAASLVVLPAGFAGCLLGLMPG
jgi:hypothetical protein